MSFTVVYAGLILMVFSLLASPLFVFRLPGLSGFLLNLLLAGTGCQLLIVNQDDPLMARGGSDRIQNLIVEVRSPPVHKNGGISCLVSIRWRVVKRRCLSEREQLMVCFRDTVTAAEWQPGCLRLLRVKLSPVRNPGVKSQSHAGTFDYVAWCSRRHIHARAFISSENGCLLSSPRSFDLQSTLSGLQETIRLICRRYIPDVRQGGLLEALLIGYTRDLDPEVLKSYSDAGVVHIIAISGLHLALIGGLLQLLLLRLGPGPGVRLFRLLSLLTIVWAYSLLTGASPSVLRSAVMFSFVLLAKHFALQAPVCNALAASAFLLVCSDPYRLWDTGFQLSYSAVLSLVLFAAPVRQWITLSNKWLVALWTAASVSIAAQVLTTPISIWYFHRFPFYFLLSNLVAVPLSSGILLGGIALVIFSGIPPVAEMLGLLLDAALRLMNAFIACTNRLPGAAVTSIQIHPLQVILCYSMLYSVCRFSEKGNKSWLFGLLVQFCIFLVDGLNN